MHIRRLDLTIFIWWALLFTILSVPASAQDFYTIFAADQQFSSGNDYEQAPQYQVDILESAVSLSLPIVFENKDALIFGLGMNRLEMNTNIPEDTLLEHKYFRYRMQLGYRKVFNDRADMVVMVIPNVSSDMNQLSSEDYQLGGLVLFSKVRHDSLKWKYGLYANAEFFGPFIVPLIGMDWKFSRRIRFFGVLPARFTAQYKLNDHWRTGLKFAAPNYSYRLSDSPDDHGEPDHISAYVHSNKNELHGYLEYYLTGGLVVQARAGYTVFRRIRLYDSEDTFTLSISGIGFGGRRQPIPEPAYRDFKDGWVFHFRLAYRFSLEN